MVNRCSIVTTLEICLICFSIVETIVSGVLYMRMKRETAQKQAEAEEAVRKYEELTRALPIGRNLL